MFYEGTKKLSIGLGSFGFIHTWKISVFSKWVIYVIGCISYNMACLVRLHVSFLKTEVTAYFLLGALEIPRNTVCCFVFLFQVTRPVERLRRILTPECIWSKLSQWACVSSQTHGFKLSENGKRRTWDRRKLLFSLPVDSKNSASPKFRWWWL